jgi:type IV secretory pathway VirB4 component
MNFSLKNLQPQKELSKEIFANESLTINDITAPSSIKIEQNYFQLEEKIGKSFFIFSYPRYLTTGWLSPIINYNIEMDLSFFFHPIDTEMILKRLMRRVTEVQAELAEREEKGLIRDPSLEISFRDLEELRDKLQTAQERMFHFALYLTVFAQNLEEIRRIELSLREILESRLIYIKPALFQQKEGFISTCPYALDELGIHTLMNTSPISSMFPFISFDLSSNDGILYGVNKHNNSLILFDRFSLENANMVVFAKSGSGKSFFQKIEILRSLMLGVDVIVIDPENEYLALSEAVNGSFFKISLSSENHINPFDLPIPREGEDPADVLRSNVVNLVGLLRIILGGLSPEEDAIADRAITETYAAKDITPESDFSKITPPLMADLEEVLENMEGGESLVKRLRKHTKGTFANFFNNQTNIDMDNSLVVFGIRDMEEELRPAAMYVILRYIWNKVRSVLKKRILVVDEAWWLMKSEDGASFLYGIAKRARKYWLGVSTITQDVEDFMRSSYGMPIVTNSSIQMLMKQSPATIDSVCKTFTLTEEEKFILLETSIGEGIFLAGQKRVAMQVVASPGEYKIVTTKPEDLMRLREEIKQKQ